MKALEIVEAVDKFSGRRLREKDTIEILIAVAIENNLMHLIDDLAFHSKFLWRLFNFLRGEGGNHDEAWRTRILTQVYESAERIRKLLLDILEKFPDFEREKFVDKFLRTDAQSFENFMNLVYDFYWFKNWQIDARKR